MSRLRQRHHKASLIAFLIFLAATFQTTRAQPGPPQKFHPASNYTASVSYERYTAEAVARNASITPYLLGGVLRASCLAPGGACTKPGVFSQMCTLRKPNPNAWTSFPDLAPQICYNSPGFSIDRVKDFMLGVQKRYSKWMPADVPGPVELTPVDFWSEIRGERWAGR